MQPRADEPHDLSAPHFRTQVSLADVQAVLQLVIDDNIDFSELAQDMESRPAIALHMRRRASSVGLGAHFHPRSLRQCLAILGLRRIREILFQLHGSLQSERPRVAG